MKIFFKYPTLRRPDWFKQTLETYYSMLSGEIEYEFMININLDDETMMNATMQLWMLRHKNLYIQKRDYKTKVEAINHGLAVETFDILFLVSDDMIPIVPGFDLIIAEKMKEHFPDTDGALHFNDDCCGKDKCITLSIMGRKLYDRFRYIYHPDYKSFFCDNEFTDEVYRMKKVIYSPQIIVKHDWRGWNTPDETYKRNSKLGREDENTYERRKLAGFPR